MTPSRVALIEYISMTTSTQAAFVFRAPPLSYVSNIYYLPFTTTVWICLIILLITSVIVIFVTYKLPKIPSDEFYVEDSPSDFFILCIEIVCQMGTYFTPKSLSGRISFVNISLLRMKFCSN